MNNKRPKENNYDKNNPNQLNFRFQLPQNPSLNSFSPKNSKCNTLKTISKSTPMGSKYKFESFSNIYQQQQQQQPIQSNRTNSPFNVNSQSQLNSTNLNNLRRQSAYSRHSQDLSQPNSTPTSKKIKEYIFKNSITGLLGVKQNDKEILDKKTLSQFSRIQKNLNKQNDQEKGNVQPQQKRIVGQKTQQSSTSNNNQDDSILTQDQKNKQYKLLLDVEVAKADIYQKWIPQQQQKLMTQNSTNIHLNLSSLNQKTLTTQEKEKETPQQINSQSSRNLSAGKKIKYFKENEDKRKQKYMVKQNQKILNKQNRKFGTFVEFSKVGPARSITCLQTRTDHLLNQNPDKLVSKLPLQVYSSGSPIVRDITQWKISRPQSSNSFFVTSNIQKLSTERAKKVITKLNVQLEQDTKEQIQGRTYKIRSNLDSVVKNMRKINLTQTNISANKSNLSMSQNQNSLSTMNSPKLVLDFLSPRGVSASLTLNSPQSGMYSTKDFLSPQNVFSRTKESNFAFVSQKQKPRESIKEEEIINTESSMVASPTKIENKAFNLYPKFNLSISTSKFATAMHSPNQQSEDQTKLSQKRSNFVSVK